MRHYHADRGIWDSATPVSTATWFAARCYYAEEPQPRKPLPRGVLLTAGGARAPSPPRWRLHVRPPDRLEAATDAGDARRLRTLRRRGLMKSLWASPPTCCRTPPPAHDARRRRDTLALRIQPHPRGSGGSRRRTEDRVQATRRDYDGFGSASVSAVYRKHYPRPGACRVFRRGERLSPETREPFVRLRCFQAVPGVPAVDGVDLDILPGEVQFSPGRTGRASPL